MGAVNYGTSDYISMGLDVNTEFDYEKPCFHEDYFTYLSEMLDNRRFWYFHIAVKSGYYEGFWLDIENNFPVYFDNWEEKRDAQKEITEIKRFLLECAADGLVQYAPGWCMGYSTEQETRAAINAAIKKMRQEVKETPTCRQYNAT